MRMHEGGGKYTCLCILQLQLNIQTRIVLLLSNNSRTGFYRRYCAPPSAMKRTYCTLGGGPLITQKSEMDENVPSDKERIHSVSQNIIRLPPNQKHIHLIRKIISNVVHELDVDSRWTCRWTAIIYFPDDKMYI